MKTKTAQIPEDATGQPRRVVVGKLRLSDTFRALRHRNYRLFFTGQLVSLTGTWMEQTAMGWLIYQISGSKLLLGLVAAAGSAPLLLFSLWGGVLADRFPKRTILVVTQAVAMLVALFLALVIWLGHVQPWHIVVFAVIGGIANAFDMPARQAFTIELAGREDLMNAISLNSSAINGARIIGPSLAGLLMAQAGAAMCFLINGVSFIAVIIGLLMMRLAPHVKTARDDPGRAGVLSGLKYVRNHQRVLTIMSLFGIVGVFGWSYTVLMPAIGRDVLQLSENRYGVLLSASSVGALTGALFVATAGQRFVPKTLAFTGLAIFSVALLIFSRLTLFPAVLVCLAFAGFGMMLFFSTSNTTVQTIVPDEMRGRVMGVWSLVFGGMIPLGSLQAGLLAEKLGPADTLTIGALVCGAAGLVTWAIVRRRDARAARAPATG